MRVVNVNYVRPVVQSPRMGQPSNFIPTREVSFRIVDENGNHIVNGKKFPFMINRGYGAPITGTAVSKEEGPASSIVKIQLQALYDPSDAGPQAAPVYAALSLNTTTKDGVTYPIFENKKFVFTAPLWNSPAAPTPLDLQPIYAKYDADKYAAEQAVLDAEMLKNYQDGVATEAQAQAAADKAKAAAADAASKTAAADAAVQVAVNESSKNRTLFAVAGVAVLGLIAYFAFEG
jgi:hypothetical protein